MRSLVSYFIKYKVAVNTLMVIIMLTGLVAFFKIKASFFPLIPVRIIQVQAVYPGASPIEVEEGITNRIEEQLKGVSGVERITSTSSENLALVTIETEKGYDTDEALEDIKNAVNTINSFPEGMEKPLVFKRDNSNFTISYVIAAAQTPLKTLKNYARIIEKDLLSHDGISEVTLNGFPDEEIEVAFDEENLRRYKLTLAEAAAAIRASNIDLSGGTIDNSQEELLIRSRNKNLNAEGIENIVIKGLDDGRILRVKDVAIVNDQFVDNPNKIVVNGKQGAEIRVFSTDREDLLKNAEYVRNYFKEFEKVNPQLDVTLTRDLSDTLNERKNLLLENGIFGIILVLLLLSLFLNIRLAFWVAIGLPVAFLGMFLIAYFYGITINVISLFGMIVVVGILVDDAIVIGENVYAHYEKGKSAYRAALDGTFEVMPAVISAVLTTIIAFSFFFLVDGRSGDFFSELAFVVIATLAVSLIEALIILPAHLAHSKALKEGHKKNKFESFIDRNFKKVINKFYAPILKFSIKHRFFIFAIAFASLLVTIGALKGGIIKTTFFPNIERNSISVQLSMPAGTNENITEANLIKIEKGIKTLNENWKEFSEDSTGLVLNVLRKVGPTSSEGSLEAILVESEKRSKSSADISGELRKIVGSIDGAENLSYGTRSPFGRPIAITLLGDNPNVLNAAKEELRSRLNQVSDIKDINENVRQGAKEINIKLKEKAYLLGFNEISLMNQVRQGFFGFEVQRLLRGRDEIKIWVRYNQQTRSSIDNLKNVRIRLANGTSIPLQELADISIKRGVIAIQHLDGNRQVTIDGDVSNPKISATDIMSAIRNEIIPEILPKYQGVQAIYEGQNREAQKTQKSSKSAGLLVLGLILAVITFTFRSFWQAFLIIFFLVPFALVGVGWGHYLQGHQMSILSFLGVVALIGIIVNDSLVLVSKMNGFLKEGYEFVDAVYEAGKSRFRAIFLTSATTVAGLAPLMYDKSFQAQFLQPMAVSVAYGIALATVLTLILLPVLLISMNDIRQLLYRLWNLRKPSPEEVEPAVKELNEHD